MMTVAKPGLSLLVVGILVLGAHESQAQSRRGSVVPDAAPNPYMNPALNPYLNPAMTVGPTNRNDALVYLWAAQQQPGGVLGLRRREPEASRRPQGNSPRHIQAAGGASQYFGRADPSVPGTGGRFQRFDRYFSSNGR